MLEPSEVEQRLALLQSQLERVARKADVAVPPIEQRLASMADEYAKQLRLWTATVERHSLVVGQLEEYAGQWRDASRQMREDTADQLQELVTTIEKGWEALKQMQEEPIRELREHAASLTQASAAMAKVPQQDASTQWSLDDVTRLHASEGATGMPVKWAAPAIVGLAIAATLAGVLSWQLQRQVTAAEERQRVSDLKNQAALDETARQSEAARLAAAKELATAREMANRVQRIAAVLAAPDLIRFSLSGADGASGQALVSRSRGFVVSGSLLPSPPANRTHQAWLLTPTTAVKMGPLAVEPDGTVTLSEQMPAVPRAIVGVMVTEEPMNGGDTPSVATVLTSVRPTRPIVN